MKRRNGIQIAALMVTCMLAFTPLNSISSRAASADNSLSELNEQKQEAQQKVDEAQSALDDASADKNSLESQADAVAAQIYAAEDTIATTSADIDTLQAELAEAHEKEDRQFQAMKKRIQYMYEVGTDNILVIMLSADNFADFLNKFEYAAEITRYDQNMIDEYKTLEETIASKSQELSNKQDELEQTQSSLAQQQDQLSGLLADADETLRAKYADLLGAKQDLDEINEAIADFKSALKAEEQANAASKAAQAQQMAAAAAETQQEQEAQQEAQAQQNLDAANAAVSEAQAQKEAADAANAAAQAAAQKAAEEQAAREAAAKKAQEEAEAAERQAAADAAAKKAAAEEAARQKAAADAAAKQAAEEAAAKQAEADQAASNLTQRKAEQEAADKWMKNKSWKTTNPYGQVGTVYYVQPMSYTQTELDELTTMLYCEAGGEGYNGQLAVASVILNRVRSSMFRQTTIHGIMFASGQFEPTWLVRSGKWSGKTMFQYFYDNREYMQRNYSAWRNCRQAALDALNGKRNTNLCFYWANSNSKPEGSIVYGNQVFFGRVVQNS